MLGGRLRERRARLDYWNTTYQRKSNRHLFDRCGRLESPAWLRGPTKDAGLRRREDTVQYDLRSVWTLSLNESIAAVSAFVASTPRHPFHGARWLEMSRLVVCASSCLCGQSGILRALVLSLLWQHLHGRSHTAGAFFAHHRTAES